MALHQLKMVACRATALGNARLTQAVCVWAWCGPTVWHLRAAAAVAGDGRFLDPTDESGQPSAWPAPGPPWPWPVDVTLSYVNEPPKGPAGAGGTNCFVEDGASPGELLFVANRTIAPGEELYIDYGLNYDRSSYRKG